MTNKVDIVSERILDALISLRVDETITKEDFKYIKEDIMDIVESLQEA